jgi:hypothetical protein
MVSEQRCRGAFTPARSWRKGPEPEGAKRFVDEEL